MKGSDNMYVKPCPHCGAHPYVHEGMKRRNGDRFYIIGCPNFCFVLRSPERAFGKSSFITVQGENPDNNEIYKRWNEELVTL